MEGPPAFGAISLETWAQDLDMVKEGRWSLQEGPAGTREQLHSRPSGDKEDSGVRRLATGGMCKHLLPGAGGPIPGRSLFVISDQELCKARWVLFSLYVQQ